MSKRSRDERRKGQLDRAVRGGDLAAIQALVDKAPEKAAAALLQAAGAPGVDPASQPFAELAVAVAARLRSVQRFELALQVTRTVRDPSPRLRLEQALAAFGAHDDGKLGELLAADPILAQFFEPCLAAMSGNAVPKLPTGASPLMRGVHGICRAVSAIVDKKPAQVRTATKAIPENQAFALRTTAWKHLSAALTSQYASSAVDAARTLLTLEPFKSQKSLQASLGWELGRRYPEAFRDRDAITALGRSAEVVGAVHLAAMGSLNDPVARLRQFLSHGDLQQLPEPDRAVAALYQAYFLLTSEPQRALDAFDRAVALGADLAETLRGRWLATLTTAAARWQASHLVDKVGEKSAERLAHLLEREADGNALLAALMVELGSIQWRAQNHQALTKTIDTLRGLVDKHGYDDEQLVSAIRAFEIGALSKTDPTRALELAEPLLNEANREPGLWELAIALLKQAGRHTDADAMMLRASALSIAPEFIEQAKSLHRKRRLATVAPDAVTPGLLANELRIRLNELDDDAKPQTLQRVLAAHDLVKAKSQLTQEAKTAFEAAALCILSTQASGNVLTPLSIELMLTALTEGRNAHWIGAAAVFAIEEEQDLMRFAKAIAEAALPTQIVEAIACWVAIDMDTKLARRFMLAVSVKLDAGAVTRVMRAVDSDAPSPTYGRLESTISAIDKVLSPEFELQAFVEGFDDDDFDDDDFDDDDFDDDDFDEIPGSFRGNPIDEIRSLLLTMGLPKRKIERLSRAQLEQVAGALMQTVSQPSSRRAFEQMVQVFSKFGFTPSDFDGMRNGSSRPGRAKGFDTCPF